MNAGAREAASRTLGQWGSYAALLAAILGVYFACGRMSLSLAITPGYASAVWPPSGIALAAALLFGARVWPAIWIGAALVNVSVESSLVTAAAIATGNTLEALVGMALIRRHAGDPGRFERAEEVLKFVALCAAAAAVAATGASLWLALRDGMSWPEGWRNGWTWWQGDLSGMIIVAPLLLGWSRRDAGGGSAERRLETVVFAALLGLAALLLLAGDAPEVAPLSLTFVTLPFIIWAALRLGQREVSTATAVVCAIAVWHTLRQDDAAVAMNERLLLLLTFNGMVVTTGLVLAAVVREGASAMERLRRRHDRLESLTHRDPLTGLPNATLFRQQLEQLLRMAAGTGRKLAVALVDIERFRMVSDSLGSRRADELLNQIAERLTRQAARGALVARVAGDTFALAAHGFADEAAVARAVREQSAGWFAAPYRLGDDELRVSAHIGLAVFPDDGDQADLLFRHAESALRKAKSDGERVVFYAPKMSERAAEKLLLETRLHQAVERQEFLLFYQPKVDVHTRRICGLEALMRWRSPELGLVSPLQFIPALEETGLIVEVGRWALRQAVRDQAGWAAAGLPVPRVAVNVSSLQLRHPQFAAHVREAIAGAHAGPLIDLEITESHLMESVTATIASLRAVRDLGVGVAVDDFGTGYSSLAYLAKLPASMLKIDRAFISRMLEDDGAMTLVQTILSLSVSLRLRTVAEGVETDEQADMLALLGCDEMQGYLISMALPHGQIAPLLARQA